jgi:hypothetical protein
MVQQDCFFCSVTMSKGCARCNWTGFMPLTERETREIVFRAEAVLQTEKPKDATEH